jgi:hypothetical protein
MALTSPDIEEQQTGTESALTTYAGPYVTDMLGRGAALGDMPYEAYMGPLTAGTSDLQTKAFEGIGSLNIPTDTMGAFTPSTISSSGPSTIGGISGLTLGDQVELSSQPQPISPAFDPMSIKGADKDFGAGDFRGDINPKQYLQDYLGDDMIISPPTQTNTNIQNYMNPYLMSALQPQIDEARRQSEISRVADAGRLTQAGAYGGSRQAIMDAENQRNLLQNLSGITGAGYRDAYDKAVGQFNIEQDRARGVQEDINRYGLAAIQKAADLGATQRGIESEGIAADYGQFREERDFPYTQVQFLQSLLSGLPLQSQSYSYTQPTGLEQTASDVSGVMALLNALRG